MSHYMNQLLLDTMTEKIINVFHTKSLSKTSLIELKIYCKNVSEFICNHLDEEKEIMNTLRSIQTHSIVLKSFKNIEWNDIVVKSITGILNRSKTN